MTHSYDAVVVGGGLAGSSCAKTLASRGHSVLLLESERYPVHKLCGEFLSPEARSSLDALGVEDSIRAAGAVEIRRVAITATDGSSWDDSLPTAGLGISRWTLDALLFDAARAAGAETIDGVTVSDINRSSNGDFEVVHGFGDSQQIARCRLVLGCYGKRSTLDRKLARGFMRRRNDYVAFKAHHRGLELDDWIELHAFDGGYCGMSHVEDGIVNVCLIAWTSALRASGATFQSLQEKALTTNPALAKRLAKLTRTDSEVVSIGQVPFSNKGLFANDVMMVGDSAGMIAPLCGDGMAMALRAAELAAPLASSFLSGDMSFEMLRREYRVAWESEFARRLRIGRALQRGLFNPRLSSIGIRLMNAMPWVGRSLVRATRG